MQNNQYDIAVIGGGPAGLQATLMLARTRKRILVFDDPQPPRNGASHGVHNVLGMDDLRPAEIRELVWKQIDVYQSVELRQERVINIQRDNDNLFLITVDKGLSITARQVILTIGYQDVYPDVLGFVDCWADTIINCPFCDGYENRDRVWGIVASSEIHAQHFPKMLWNWTPHVKLILLPDAPIDPAYQAELGTLGIPVYQGAITQIQHTDGKVESVTLESGEQIEVGTLLWIPSKKPLPLIQTLVDNLGLELDDNSFVKTNEMKQTNVDGLWAAGDVQGGFSAMDAAYTGMIAASMIVKGWYG